MKTPVKDIADQARRSIESHAEVLGSKNALYVALEEFGISKSWIQKFSSGHRDNPTQDQLDKLTSALDEISKRLKQAA